MVQAANERFSITVAGAWRSEAVMEKLCEGPDEVEGASYSFITWERLLVRRAPSFSPILCGVRGFRSMEVHIGQGRIKGK